MRPTKLALAAAVLGFLGTVARTGAAPAQSVRDRLREIVDALDDLVKGPDLQPR